MGPRERRVHKLSDVRMPRMDRHPRAGLDHLPDPVDVREVDHRGHALRVQVERQRGDVDVPGPFAVAEDASLDPLRTREYGELRAGDPGPAVVVWMHRQAHTAAPRHGLFYVLD